MNPFNIGLGSKRSLQSQQAGKFRFLKRPPNGAKTTGRFGMAITRIVIGTVWMG